MGGDGCILTCVNTLLCMSMPCMILKIVALFVMLDKWSRDDRIYTSVWLLLDKTHFINSVI